MFLWWTRRLWSSAVSVSVCCHAAVFLLLTRSCEGQYQMVGSSTPVLAMLGEGVVLPCHLEPAADESKSTVEWSRSDLSPRFVHLRRDGVDLLNKQHPSYAGRTRLSSTRLKLGDLSLQLSSVKLSDEGKYSCIAPGKASTEVHLLVGAAPPTVAVSAEADGPSGGVVLSCESAGWYPEPELLWLDSEGKPLSAGPPGTLRGPDGLYSVSSRVTVETRPSNTFSCRVQQSNISQSRTAQFSFEGEFFGDESSSVALIVIVVVLAVCFIISSSALFAFWKLKLNNKSDNKPQKDEEVPLVDQSSRTKDLEEEILRLNEELKKKQEEENELVGVMEMMKKWEEEVKETKDQKTVQLEEVEKMIKEKEERVQKLQQHLDNQKPNKMKKEDISKKVQLSQEKETMIRKQSYLKGFLESTDNKLKYIEDIIKIFRKQKERAGTEIQKMREQIETVRERKQEAVKASDGGNC